MTGTTQKTRGGKTVYGASVGILMLETQFPRVPGDIGNALSWPFPVQYGVVGGATPDNVVRGDPEARLQDFIDEGQRLVRMGCDGIATNCGFLVLLQDQLRQALDVPVATSSLMQAALIAATLPPGQHVSILTISSATLTQAHLDAARVPQGTPVLGTDPNGAFTQEILGDAYEIDFDACRADLREAAARLMSDHPKTGAILLECTNMVPYAAAIRAQTGVPVYSIHSFVSWFQAGLAPRSFPGDLPDWR